MLLVWSVVLLLWSRTRAITFAFSVSVSLFSVVEIFGGFRPVKKLRFSSRLLVRRASSFFLPFPKALRLASLSLTSDSAAGEISFLACSFIVVFSVADKAVKSETVAALFLAFLEASRSPDGDRPGPSLPIR